MYIERQYDTYAKKKNENKYSKSLNMQYKEKKNKYASNAL